MKHCEWCKWDSRFPVRTNLSVILLQAYHRTFIWTIQCRLQEKYRTAWFMELSRDIARSWNLAAEKGIDFGDTSLKEFVRYYCRDNSKEWHRFFVSYKEIRRELDHLALLKQYE